VDGGKGYLFFAYYGIDKGRLGCVVEFVGRSRSSFEENRAALLAADKAYLFISYICKLLELTAAAWWLHARIGQIILKTGGQNRKEGVVNEYIGIFYCILEALEKNTFLCGTQG